jgi:hypothetical protein
MNIGEILSRAWKIVWKHKILWLFGILASCGQASGSSSGGSSGSSGGSSQVFHLPLAQLLDTGNMEWLFVLLLIAGAVIFSILFIALMMALNTVGRVGIVRGVLLAEAGQEKISFGELLSGVKPFFWRVLGLNLLVFVGVFAIVFAGIIAMTFVAIFTLGLGFILLIPMIFLFIPLMWAVVVLQEQANVALIVEDIGIIDALKRSWRAVVAKPVNYLVMGLILILGMGLVALVVIGLPMFLVFIPMIIGFIVNDQAAVTTGLILSGVCCLAYLPIMLALIGLLRSYTITSWTLSYLRWAEPALTKSEILPPAWPDETTSPEPLPDPVTGS